MKEMLIGIAIVIVLGWSFNHNIKKAYKKYKYKPLLNYCPTVWTSLGILGTFISIIYTLHFRTDYSDITRIISEISPAFSTSAIGILLSMYSSYQVKKTFAQDEENEKKAYEKVSKDEPEIVLANILSSNKKVEKLIAQLINATDESTKNYNSKNGILTKMFVDAF